MPICLEKSLSDKCKAALLKTIQDAIDSRNEDLIGYPTKNAKANLFWDEINKKIMETLKRNFGMTNCEPFITNRGCWKFVLLYANGIIFSIMREQRFEELRKELDKNSKSQHYATSLARILNFEVPNLQGRLFVDDDDAYKQAANITSKLLQNIDVDSDCINGYVMVLFDADDTQLYSARMVLVNAALEVCDEYDLKDYIEIKEPVMVDSVQEYPHGKPEDPSKGLKLTGKAEARKAKKLGVLKQKSASEVNENIK